MVGAKNHTEPQPHPLASFSNLRKAWNNLTANTNWWAPGPILDLWEASYMELPSSWFGSCVLGSIRPSFFLLPLRQGEKLGVPIYEEKLSRHKWGAL
jgi:hypothetical protein